MHRSRRGSRAASEAGDSDAAESVRKSLSHKHTLPPVVGCLWLHFQRPPSPLGSQQQAYFGCADNRANNHSDMMASLTSLWCHCGVIRNRRALQCPRCTQASPCSLAAAVLRLRWGRDLPDGLFRSKSKSTVLLPAADACTYTSISISKYIDEHRYGCLALAGTLR